MSGKPVVYILCPKSRVYYVTLIFLFYFLTLSLSDTFPLCFLHDSSADFTLSFSEIAALWGITHLVHTFGVGRNVTGAQQCMCVYMYMCVYNVCVYMCMSTYIYVHVYMFVCMHVYVYTCVYVNVYMCMSV